MSGHLMLGVRSAGGVASTSRRPLQTTTSGTRVKPRRGGVNSGGSDTCRAKWSDRYLRRFDRLGDPFSDGRPPERGGLAALRFVGGFYHEVRIPNLCRGLPFGDALGPDLPPARP